jgi:serine/threonine protein kinase
VDGTLIGSQFAGYSIDGIAGRGGMGVVYRATELALDRSVALKLVAPELAANPGFRNRFIAESRIAASLDHPNVVPIYHAGESDGTLFLAMRFVPGDDLGALIDRDGPVEPARVAAIIAQVASALDAAHECELIHRDIKPANVLLTGNDHVYLSDFGLSKRLASHDASKTRTAGLLGTLDYVAPEQIRAGEITPATDVYALGCLLFHALTGRVPFPLDTEEAKLWAHLSEPPPKPSAQAGVPSGLDAVVAKAMSKKPGDRYATAGELARAATAAVAPPPSEPSKRERPRVPGPRRPEVRTGVLVQAMIEPFNLIVLAALILAGFLLDELVLMIPLGIAVYALAVAISYRSPQTRERALDRGHARRRRSNA